MLLGNVLNMYVFSLLWRKYLQPSRTVTFPLIYRQWNISSQWEGWAVLNIQKVSQDWVVDALNIQIPPPYLILQILCCVQNFMDVTSMPPQMSQEVYYTCVFLVYYEGNTCGLVKLLHSFEFIENGTFLASRRAGLFETFRRCLSIVLWVHWICNYPLHISFSKFCTGHRIWWGCHATTPPHNTHATWAIIPPTRYTALATLYFACHTTCVSNFHHNCVYRTQWRRGERSSPFLSPTQTLP